MSLKLPLRLKAKAIRAHIDEESRALDAAALGHNILGYFEATAMPAILGFYWPFGTEIDLMPFIRLMQNRDDPALCLPVARKGEAMAFYRWTPETPMQSGDYAMMEPAIQANPLIPDMLLLPLLLCDRDGARLGYGEGHYDRAIAQMQAKPKLVGVCFDEQVYEGALPVEAHDVKLDVIITPKRIIEIE